MGLIELSRHYFATTPMDDIRKDWELTKEYDYTGVTVSELLRYWEEKKTNQNKTKMENLLNCNGLRFSAKIKGSDVEGKITVEDGDVYLCQNEFDGLDCTNKSGYKYSWRVGIGDKTDLSLNNVYDLKIFNLTQKDIDEYKYWQVGDVVKLLDEYEKEFDELHEVIFRSGELVVLKNKDGEASDNYTCDQLHKYGFRLVPPKIEEDKEEVILTKEEIAEKFGIPVDKIRIKND